MPVKIILICAALLPATVLSRPAAAQEPEVSTAAPARVQSPLFLTVSKDSYSSRVGLDYAIRWDFSDLASFRPSLGFLYSGIKAVSNWDITENTRLEYYGLKTNPWRLILSDRKYGRAAPAASGAAAGGEAGGSAVVSRPPSARRRIRFSLSPLVEDLKNNFDEGLRDYLLKSSMQDLTPEWGRAGEAGRKAFVQDVLSLGIWDLGVPGVKQAGEGLEYISNGKNCNGRK